MINGKIEAKIVIRSRFFIENYEKKKFIIMNVN